MQYHPLTKIITDLLKSGNLWFEIFEHEEVKTSEEAAKIRTGYTLHQGAKALILRVKNITRKHFMMVIIPGDKRLDNAKLKSSLQLKDIRFATEEEVSEITDGVKVGGVPPFGNLFGIEVIVDPEVLANEKIVFNAGDRRFSVAMYAADYQKMVKPKVVSVIE